MPTPDDEDPAALDAFIERWKPAHTAELANAQPFLIELAALLGVPGHEPATKDPARDGYVFERPVDFQDVADAGTGRIDLRCVPGEGDRPVTVEAVAPPLQANSPRRRCRHPRHADADTSAA